MNYDRFIGLVQNRAQLGSMGEAVAATRATLETLAERIDPHEAHDLASQLPSEIGAYLEGNLSNKAQRFSFDTFCHRVAQRERVEIPAATYHARCVAEVLKEAVTEGEIRDVRSQLPEDFQPLFNAGSRGGMSAQA